MKRWMLCVSLAVLAANTTGNDTADVPECLANDECAADRVCAKQKCVDPCPGVCGPHTVCHVTNHVSMCSCSPGHSGHPIIGCSASPEVPGGSGCSGHDHCPASKVCVQGKCEDPCDGLCGDNTTCTVRHHIPACACKDGYSGDPFFGCVKIVSRTLASIPQGKKMFYLETSKTADWQGAMMACLRNHSRLANVESMEEMDEIRHLISLTGIRLGQFWTSGSDHGYEGDYVWASNGKKLSSMSDLWLRNQPDNWQSNEHCVEVWERFQYQGYGLNDRPCSDNINYICEYYR